MNQFLLGVSTTLMGACALTAYAYYKGWLQAGVSRLLNDSQNRSRRSVRRRLDQAQEVCAAMTALNSSFEWPAGDRRSALVRDFDELGSERRDRVDEMLRLAQELTDLAASFREHCFSIASNTINLSTAYRATPTSAASSAPSGYKSFRFDENEEWMIYNAQTGMYQAVDAEDLNELLDRGKVFGRDFFAVPRSTVVKR